MPYFKPGDIVELIQVSHGMPSGGRYIVRHLPTHDAPSIHAIRIPDATTFWIRPADCRLILPFSDLNALLDQIATEPPCPPDAPRSTHPTPPAVPHTASAPTSPSALTSSTP